MSGLTLRTKFLGGFAALLIMIATLTFTSMRAMSSPDGGLDRVVHRTSVRADRTSQLGETLSDIGGRQQALLLHSVLNDAAASIRIAGLSRKPSVVSMPCLRNCFH